MPSALATSSFVDLGLLAFNALALAVMRPWYVTADAVPESSGGKDHFCPRGNKPSRFGAGVFRVFGVVLACGIFVLWPTGGAAAAAAPPPAGGGGAVATPSRIATTLLWVILSDSALLPYLLEVARFKRHFELFIGVSWVVSAFAYNVTDALRVPAVYLSESEWHKMNNVLSCTSFVLLSIHLARVRSELRVVALRYFSFAFITIGQVRDGFWMEESFWTLPPIVAFGVLLPLGMHLRRDRSTPLLRREKLYKGLCCAVMGGACFLRQVSSEAPPPPPPAGGGPGSHWKSDTVRFWHGVFHWWTGCSLFFLWGAVPVTERIAAGHGRTRADSSMTEWQ